MKKKISSINISLTVAIELIVQHIRDFLNNRRGIELGPHSSKGNLNKEDQGGSESTSTSESASESKQTTPKKKIESHSHSMHRPH